MASSLLTVAYPSYPWGSLRPRRRRPHGEAEPRRQGPRAIPCLGAAWAWWRAGDQKPRATFAPESTQRVRA